MVVAMQFISIEKFVMGDTIQKLKSLAENPQQNKPTKGRK